MAASEAYEGAVCYMGGWHWTVVSSDAGDEPGDRLVLDDAGVYHLADETDTESWHDRKHQSFATFQMEDGAATRVTAEEFAAIQELLAERRGA